MAPKLPKLFGKKKKKDNKNKGKNNKQPPPPPPPKKNKRTSRIRIQDSDSSDDDDDDNSSTLNKSVQFDESSNFITEFKPVSAKSKNKMWHDQKDLQQNRKEVLTEKSIERTQQKVREAVEKELGAFATSRKIDKRVAQVLKGSSQEIGEYLQMQGVTFSASQEELEDKIRGMVKSKLVTDRRNPRASFSSSNQLDSKVDAVMGLDREEILEYLELDEDSSLISPEWRKDEKGKTPDLISSDDGSSSSSSSFGGKAESKPKSKNKNNFDIEEDSDDDSEEQDDEVPKPSSSKSKKKKKSKKADKEKAREEKDRKELFKSPNKKSKKSSKNKAPESTGRLSFSQPLPTPEESDDNDEEEDDDMEVPKKKKQTSSSNEKPKAEKKPLSFSEPLPKEKDSSSDDDGSATERSKMWFEDSPSTNPKPKVQDEANKSTTPKSPKQGFELEVPTKTTPMSPLTPNKKEGKKGNKEKDKSPPRSKSPVRDNNDTDDDDDDDAQSDDSPPRKKAIRGLSTYKSAVVVSMEEALNREGVDDYLKEQIIRVMEEKNRGIESLEEALDEANDRYLTLKDKQRKFIAVQEELEALARNQQRKLEIMTRELQRPKETSDQQQQDEGGHGHHGGLDKECQEIEALREALDEANARTSKIKSKDRKMVAAQEELESLCRRQQAQIERAERDHFDRLKAKDVLNEALKEQLKHNKQTIQEKDKIISMLQQKNNKSPSSTTPNEDSNDDNNEDEIRDIHDELIDNLKSKDELIDSLREQVREARKTNREQVMEIQSLERQLRDAKKGAAPSPPDQQQQSRGLPSPTPSDEADKDESGGGSGEKTIKMLREKLEHSEERLQKTDSKLETTRDELDEANARIAELEKEVNDDHLDEKDKDYKAELTEARSNIRELERKLKKEESPKSEGGEASSSLEKEQEKIKGLERKIKMLESRSASDRFNTTIVAEETPDEKLERLKKKMEDELEEKEEELVFAQSRISALENQLKAAGGETTGTDSDDKKDAEIKELQEQVENLERDLRFTVKDRDKQWNEKDEEIEKLKEELANIQSAKDERDPATSSDVDAKEAKIKNLQEALEKSKEEADESIQKLENTVSELQDQLMKQMDQTKEDEPPSGNKDEEIETLKQQVENLERDLRYTVKDRDKKWNEKDEEIELLKEQLQQASTQSREVAAQSGEEVLELKGKLEKETVRASTLQTELLSLQDRMKLKSKAVESSQKELERNESKIQSLKTERKSLHDLLNQKTSAVESTQGKLQENEELIRSLQQQIENQKAETERLRTAPKLDTPDKAALQADLDITKQDLREARKSLKLEMASNEKAKRELLNMESDLEDRIEELALMEKQTELASLLQDQVDHLKKSLEKNKRTIESQASQIDSLKDELEMRTATVSRGDLEEILEVAQLNSELEKADIELKREKTALKKAKKRITKLESDLKGTPESASDLQQKLHHQIQISEVLAEQLETSKASNESKTGVIDSMKQELGDKEQHIRSLEAALGKKRKSGSSDSQASDNTTSMQRRIRKQLEEEIYDLQRRLRKEQSMNKRSSKKIAKLEEELDEQIADWVALENEMDETKASMAKIESQLAKEQAKKRKQQEKKPRRSSRSANNGGEDFNLYLDGLTRKVREARNQLETAHGRLDEAVSRHRVPRNQEAVYSA